MAVYSELLFYTVDPTGVFNSTIGSFSNWSGASAPDGNATIYDAEAGTGGEDLDDDLPGGTGARSRNPNVLPDRRPVGIGATRSAQAACHLTGQGSTP